MDPIDIDNLRESTPDDGIPLWTNHDYFRILDSEGRAWRTGTLLTGEQVKYPFQKKRKL